jgi:hypothetical protein
MGRREATHRRRPITEGADVSYRTDMEAAFEEWFKSYRVSHWKASRPDRANNPPSQEFCMGLRASFYTGWMGAVLWCRLCQREHEGACHAAIAPKESTLIAHAPSCALFWPIDRLRFCDCGADLSPKEPTALDREGEHG